MRIRRRNPRSVSSEVQELADELHKRLGARDVERSAVTRKYGPSRALKEAIDRLPAGDPQRDVTRAGWVSLRRSRTHRAVPRRSPPAMNS